MLLSHAFNIDYRVVAVRVKASVAPLAYDYVILVQAALTYGAYVVLQSIIDFLLEFLLLQVFLRRLLPVVLAVYNEL